MKVVFICDTSLASFCGAPPSESFLEIAHQQFSILREPESRGIYQHFFDLLAYLKPLLDKEINSTDINALFSHSFFLQQMGYLSKTEINLLRQMMALVYQNFMLYPYHRGQAFSYAFYLELLDFIKSLQRLDGFECSLIQGGYDLSLELSCVNNATEYHYGILPQSSGMPIYKLFGSLNWFEQGSEMIYPVDLASNLIALTEVRKLDQQICARLAFQNQIESLLPAYRDISTMSYEPCVYPWLASNVYYHPKLKSVWRQSFEALKCANYIIFVGAMHSKAVQRSLLTSALALNESLIQMYVCEPLGLTSRTDAFWNSTDKLHHTSFLKVDLKDIVTTLKSTFEWTGGFREEILSEQVGGKPSNRYLSKYI